MAAKVLCAQRGDVTPVNCCETVDCSLLFQYKESIATLCGYSEWTGFASVPPKKFLVLNQGGHFRFLQFTSLACSVSGGPDIVCNWSGVCSYNPAGCVLTAGGIQNCGGGDASNCGNLGGDFTPGSPDTNTTSTNLDAKVTGACRVGGPSGFGKYTEADQYAHLSNEDTEDDAIARANAIIGSWTTCSSAPCTAYKEARGAGDFTLAYRNQQLRIYIPSGGAVGINYEARINLRRRLYGTTDAFVDWAYIQDTFTGTGGTPHTGPWYNMPVQSGYEVEANVCVVGII